MRSYRQHMFQKTDEQQQKEAFHQAEVIMGSNTKVDVIQIRASGEVNFYLAAGALVNKVIGLNGKEVTTPVVGKLGDYFFEKGVIFAGAKNQNQNYSTEGRIDLRR